jgi:hypothetical protein
VILDNIKELCEQVEQQGVESALKEGWLEHSKADHILYSMLKKYELDRKKIEDYIQKLREEYEF